MVAGLITRASAGAPAGTAAQLASVAGWIDEQLGNELADRQYIAETAVTRIRDITLQVLDAARPAAGHVATCRHCGRPIAQSADTTGLWWAADNVPVGEATACSHEPAAGASATNLDGSARIAAEDVGTVLGALADAVAWCTDDEDCGECSAAPDGLCESHAGRLGRVPAYRALAARMEAGR
ncbi:MAG: hypothetical protein ACHP9Z_30085 [Streptosporangiales bacterium]